VPNMPIDEYRHLGEAARAELLSNNEGLRPIAGLEKVSYLLRATPESYLLKFSVMVVPLFFAGLSGAALVRRENEA
jgi:hypothetical protein